LPIINGVSNTHSNDRQPDQSMLPLVDRTPLWERGYPAALYLLCLLLIVSPLGTWVILDFGPHYSRTFTFDYRSGSPGWQFLLLSVAILISVTAAHVTHTREPRVIAATVWMATTIVAGTSIVQYALFSAGAGSGSWTIGWGLWLCFASSLVGTVVGVGWAKSHRP
jgi:hypothetical protein